MSVDYAASQSSQSQIRAYWNERACSYSCGVCQELAGREYPAWERVLTQASQQVRNKAASQGRAAQVLDIGCGPGFFSILFARMGCAVTGIDMSPEMLDRARGNLKRAGNLEARLMEADAARLPFADNTFDLVVSRNVTWLMKDPEAVYAEWQRVLRPGGKLLFFDANWYRYLVDAQTRRQRALDQSRARLDWGEEVEATSDQEARCEAIALGLPLTYELRPAWDRRCLDSLGFSAVSSDETVWRSLWSDNEQAFYGSSPLFMVEATK